MSQETFIARQPIFDSGLTVIGYELLHRAGWEESFGGIDEDLATVEVLNGSLLVSRLEDLTDGKLGFVNVPRNLLLEDFLLLLPARLTVIEVLESVRPEPRVVEALRKLKRAGYTIALDDFADEPDYAPLVELADIIKVDFRATAPADWGALVQRHRRPGLRFLAEKIETREEHERARAAGYDLFQGFFFCRPETSFRRDLPAHKVHYIRFLREISRPALDLPKLEEIIEQERSLGAKLLRYLNAAQPGGGSRITSTSIRSALAHLDERSLRRWGTLVALARIGDDKPLELVRTCLVRAGFLERLAQETGHGEQALDYFLTGVFSALDALVDRPLEEALESVGLDPAVCRAIEGDTSRASRARELAIACERGDLESYGGLARELGLEQERVAELYAEALFWAGGLRPGPGGRRPEPGAHGRPSGGPRGA